MRAHFAVGLAASVLVYGACGGRMIDSGSDYGGAPEAGVGVGGMASAGVAGHSAGRPSKGGAPARGGSPAGGSISIGGTAFGGSFPTAGSVSTGGGCACPGIPMCPPGSQIVPDPNGCCYHCEPGCQNVGCPAIACGSGSHPEMIPGQCCPTCVADSCDMQRTSYEQYKQPLQDKYSQGCMIDQDCTYYYEKNYCAIGCGIPVLVTTLGYLDSNLQSYAQSSCSPNCMHPVPPCAPVPPPKCVMGRCL